MQQQASQDKDAAAAAASDGHPIDDPERNAALRANLTVGSIVGYLTTLTLLTLGLPALGAYLSGGPLTLARATTVFLGLLAPSVVMLRWATYHRHRTLFWWTGGAQTVLQLLWIHTLAFALPEQYDLVSATVLISFVVAWVVLDAGALWDDVRLRLSYFVGLLGFWVFAFALLKLAPAYLGASSEQRLTQFALIDVILIFVSQSLLVLLGRQAREAAARQQAQLAATQEIEALRAERATLGRVSRLLSSTVAQRRFEHDAANPLMVIEYSADALSEAQDPAERDEALGELRHGVAGLRRLLAAVRDTEQVESPALVRAEDFLNQVVHDWQGVLRGHSVSEPPRVRLDVQDSPLWIGPDHAMSLASLMCNAALLAPNGTLELRGEVVDAHYYRLELRDHASEGPAQREAVRRVRDGLSMRAMGRASRGGGYRGMGIGLPLCKLQLSQHGAWIDARLPASGPGIVLEIVLPRVNPVEISEEDAKPEGRLSRGAPLEGGLR